MMETETTAAAEPRGHAISPEAAAAIYGANGILSWIYEFRRELVVEILTELLDALRTGRRAPVVQRQQ